MEVEVKAKTEDEEKKDFVRVNPWSLRITDPKIQKNYRHY